MNQVFVNGKKINKTTRKNCPITRRARSRARISDDNFRGAIQIEPLIDGRISFADIHVRRRA